MAKAEFNSSDDCFTRDIVRRKVKQLIGCAGFTSQDRNDLEQDLLVRVIQRLPMLDSDQAHHNDMVATIVERNVVKILRNKQAEMRDHRRASSLNVMIVIKDEGPAELAQTISDRELDARLNRRRRNENELAQLALDLNDVIATLPDSWRNLLELRKTKTVPEIAAKMGVPCSTLTDWMRRIRQQCKKAHLQDYLRS